MQGVIFNARGWLREIPRGGYALWATICLAGLLLPALTQAATLSPIVETGAASPTGETTATLAGSVNPRGSAVTACYFEYGPSTSYESVAACGESPGTGTEPVSVTAKVSTLLGGVTYHFRLVAGSEAGADFGEDQP